MKHHTLSILIGSLLGLFLGAVRTPLCADELQAKVEIEEDVYQYEPADNGAGPMWCYGNTCIVRWDRHVFASGLRTLPGAKPLNNCVPLLLVRGEQGWEQVYEGTRRTREPCPLGVQPGGRVPLSINPTLTAPDVYGGPAQPQILEFVAGHPEKPPRVDTPRWAGQPAFTEHSYRSFAVDGDHGELILFQNIGYAHAEWSFRDRQGDWSAQGKIVWPWGAEYDKPQPVRLCYATVALKDHAVFFCAVSDIIEPYEAWRSYKKKLTGRDWDYDFRRLFYTWSDDIRTGKFHDWVEIASRDKTCGWIFPNDLYVDATGRVLVLWSERALDERLRDEFFPDAKQRHSLEYAVLQDGHVIQRTALVEAGEGVSNLRPGRGRFHASGDGRLLVLYHVGGRDEQGQPLSENRMVEVLPEGHLGTPVTIPLRQPLASFFTATVRAGCKPSQVLDVLGDVNRTLRYVRIRVEPKPAGTRPGERS